MLASADWGSIGTAAAAVVLGAAGYIGQKINRKAEDAGKRAEQANEKADEAKLTQNDTRDRAVGAESLAGFAAHSVHQLAQKTGAWDELVRDYREMQLASIDLVRSTNEQLGKSTTALVATEHRLAECERRDTEKNNEIRSLRGEVYELKTLVSNMTGGLAKRPEKPEG